MSFLLPALCRRISPSSSAFSPSCSSSTPERAFLSLRSAVGATTRLTRTRLFSASSVLKALDMETVDTSTRLERLRGLMRENKLDVYSN